MVDGEVVEFIASSASLLTEGVPDNSSRISTSHSIALKSKAQFSPIKIMSIRGSADSDVTLRGRGTDCISSWFRHRTRFELSHPKEVVLTLSCLV